MIVQRAVWRGIEDVPKGGRERRVPLTVELAAALKDVKHPKTTRLLWKDDGSDVDENQLQLWMKQATERAGLKPTRSLHILRHTFCSHLAMRGAPTRAIQHMAGHSSIAATERYMHLSPSAEDQRPGRRGRDSSPRTRPPARPSRSDPYAELCSAKFRRRDSNPNMRNQNPLSCHWTTPEESRLQPTDPATKRNRTRKVVANGSC